MRADRIRHWVARIAALQDYKSYAEQHWEGSFEDYLDLVRSNPQVTRNAFQRVYDMILSYGKTSTSTTRRSSIRYNFFADPDFGGKDAIFGLDIPLMQLVNVFKSAAQGYGTEKRVILLHGPVGSSKSTIARLLKKGLEDYSRTPEGALYTFSLDVDRRTLDGVAGGARSCRCPMHEEPLLLIPREWRDEGRSTSSTSGSTDELQDPHRRRPLPVLPLHLRRADGPVRRRLEQGDRARAGAAG